MFGINSVSAIFQRTMESLLGDIEYVVVRIDDILISGPSKEAHLQALYKVLMRLRENGITLRADKFDFMLPSVYVFYTVSMREKSSISFYIVLYMDRFIAILYIHETGT